MKNVMKNNCRVLLLHFSSFQLSSVELLDVFFTAACFLIFWKVFNSCPPPTAHSRGLLLHKTAVFRMNGIKNELFNCEKRVKTSGSGKSLNEFHLTFASLIQLHSITKILCATEGLGYQVEKFKSVLIQFLVSLNKFNYPRRIEVCLGFLLLIKQFRKSHKFYKKCQFDPSNLKIEFN